MRCTTITRPLSAIALAALLAACNTVPTNTQCTAYAKDNQALSADAVATAVTQMLARLEQLELFGGLVVLDVAADGTITLGPQEFCRPPISVSSVPLHNQALAAIQRADYTQAGCGKPPIVIATACLYRAKP